MVFPNFPKFPNLLKLPIFSSLLFALQKKKAEINLISAFFFMRSFSCL